MISSFKVIPFVKSRKFLYLLTSHLFSGAALIFINGQEREIPISDVKIGDIIIVKPGVKIPDGVNNYGMKLITNWQG